MSSITWDPSYSVAVGELDEQHKKLFVLVNELNQAMLNRQAKESLGKVLDGLVDYTKEHFLHEEDLFKKHGYPAATVHSREHQAFIRKVNDFKNDLAAGKLMLSIEVINFLKDWLVNHIKVEDKKYSGFFNEKGLS